MLSDSRMNIYLLSFGLCLCICKFSSATGNPKAKIVKPQYLEHLLNTKRYKKFAKILGIPSTDLLKPSQRKNSIDELFSYNGMHYSDILMRPGQVLNPKQHYDFDRFINLTINTWENGTVPYYITNTYFDNETSYIENEIAYNNRMLGPNIHIRPYQDGDRDYVLFFKGGCACYTNLGNVGGPQAISLVSICLFQGAVTHEMQHTLGIAHEDNRIDRYDYIKLIHANIPKTIVSQYERYNEESFVNIGPFNYYSIMGFPNTVPGFGLPAYDILQDGIDASKIGIYYPLTPTDIQRIKTIYK